jgi:WD40 repeat protein
MNLGCEHRVSFLQRLTLAFANTKNSLLQRTLAGHSGAINKVLIADPTTVISSSQDSTVIVWNLQTAVPRWTLAGHGAIVECLMMHGNWLFTGARDGTVRAWDLDNGHRVCVLQGHTTPVWKMTVHQDRTLLATGASGGSMRISDTTSK